MKKYITLAVLMFITSTQIFGVWYTFYASDGSQESSWGEVSYDSKVLFAMDIEKYNSDLFLEIFIIPDIDGSIRKYINNSGANFSFEPIQYLHKTETYLGQIPFSYVAEMRKFFYGYTNDYSNLKKSKIKRDRKLEIPCSITIVDLEEEEHTIPEATIELSYSFDYGEYIWIWSFNYAVRGEQYLAVGEIVYGHDSSRVYLSEEDRTFKRIDMKLDDLNYVDGILNFLDVNNVNKILKELQKNK